MKKSDRDEELERSWTEFSKQIVGHKIVAWEKVVVPYCEDGLRILLDNGASVYLRGSGDCCAFTEVETVTQMIDDLTDHVITRVAVKGDHEVWTIMADASKLLKADISWSEGNGCYVYGFEIEVVR